MEISTFLPYFWNFLHTASRHCSQGDNKYPASEKCNRHETVLPAYFDTPQPSPRQSLLTVSPFKQSQTRTSDLK